MKQFITRKTASAAISNTKVMQGISESEKKTRRSVFNFLNEKQVTTDSDSNSDSDSDNDSKNKDWMKEPVNTRATYYLQQRPDLMSALQKYSDGALMMYKKCIGEQEFIGNETLCSVVRLNQESKSTEHNIEESQNDP